VFSKRSLLLSCGLVAASLCALCAQSPATESSIISGLKGLRGVPDAQRPAATTQLALDIRSLPASQKKVALADALSHLATEGDAGKATLDAVAQTLFVSLTETPQPLKEDKVLPRPYLDLARLIKYEHVHVTKDPNTPLDPLIATAFKLLAEQDAALQKVDFTLKDLHGKKVTLSDLKGKIVLVNFWATWCPPCRKEMPDLDAIYKKYADQGLVILSISDESMLKVGPFIESAGYKPEVLLDPDGTVHKLYNIDGIPKSFVYDRDGKMVAQTIDMRTGGQFLTLLEQAGLKR
jgi:thiol-disulfide isomerase/thioredoxin